MQAQVTKDVGAERGGQKRPHGARHIAFAGVLGPHPIPNRAGLRDAAPDLAQRQPAQQNRIFRPENEQGIGLVALNLFIIAANATAKRQPVQIVGCPDRLPWR